MKKEREGKIIVKEGENKTRGGSQGRDGREGKAEERRG